VDVWIGKRNLHPIAASQPGRYGHDTVEYDVCRAIQYATTDAADAVRADAVRADDEDGVDGNGGAGNQTA